MYTLCISNFVSVNRVTLYLKYSTSDVDTLCCHAASDCGVKTGLTLLQHAAPYCLTLQHAAPYCLTLQHAASKTRYARLQTLRSRTLRIVCKLSADAALFEATKLFFMKTATQNQRLVHLLKPTVLIFRLQVFARTVVSFRFLLLSTLLFWRVNALLKN